MKRTIAIQVDDAEFVAQLDKFLKDSGLTLKKWLVGIMEAALADQTQEQAQEQEPVEQVAAPDNAPEQSGETFNLFVKITSEQRETLNGLKADTGETVGSVLKRVLEDFLNHVREGSIAEDLESTYQFFASNAGLCDTKCSAVIPAQSARELAAYLESSGQARNTLMSSLVHLELQGQEQTQAMAPDMSM